MADDPFPREPFTDLITRLPRYGRLAWRLGHDQGLSRARRAAVLAGAVYLVSPVDLVPGFIPVLGQLDDLAVILTALSVALAGLSAERRRGHLDAVGLGDDHLSTDLRTVGRTTAWVGRAGWRTGRRVAVTTGRIAARGVRDVAGLSAKTARSIRERRAPHDPPTSRDR